MEKDYVVLCTVHQAKGLEWPMVFIPWLADGRFPTDMAINHAEDLEEERRVFHVAVTRAKDEVYLVVPQIYRGRGSRFLMMKPSRFLTESTGMSRSPWSSKKASRTSSAAPIPTNSPPLKKHNFRRMTLEIPGWHAVYY